MTLLGQFLSYHWLCKQMPMYTNTVMLTNAISCKNLKCNLVLSQYRSDLKFPYNSNQIFKHHFQEGVKNIHHFQNYTFQFFLYSHVSNILLQLQKRTSNKVPTQYSTVDSRYQDRKNHWSYESSLTLLKRISIHNYKNVASRKWHKFHIFKKQEK